MEHPGATSSPTVDPFLYLRISNKYMSPSIKQEVVLDNNNDLSVASRTTTMPGLVETAMFVGDNSADYLDHEFNGQPEYQSAAVPVPPSQVGLYILLKMTTFTLSFIVKDVFKFIVTLWITYFQYYFV